MPRNRTRIAIAAVVAVLAVGAVVQGRHLLTGGGHSTPTAAAITKGAAPAPGAGHGSGVAASGSTATANHTTVGAGTPSMKSASAPLDGKANPSSGATTLPPVPATALSPEVVHTAAVTMRVGRGDLGSVLRTLTTLAGTDGGYVDSSSVSGGTARRSPVAGVIVFRVPAASFSGALTALSALGTVEDQRITGKDVTITSAQNEAAITVLQDEAALFEKKLAQAIDLPTFLQIENQLTQVETQLQQLQSAEAVLQNSAALATVTVHLSAPGAALVPAAEPRPAADAASTAWRYLRHNTLAVLDGLAVGVGWALPALILLALGGAVALRVVRRRRAAVTPA